MFEVKVQAVRVVVDEPIIMPPAMLLSPGQEFEVNVHDVRAEL